MHYSRRSSPFKWIHSRQCASEFTWHTLQSHHIHISLICTGRCVGKNTLQFMSWNNVELPRRSLETLKIRFSTKYFTSVGEFMSEFSSPNYVAHAEWVTSVDWRRITHTLQVIDCYLTETLRGRGHLYIATVVNSTVVPCSDITARQNETGWNHKIKAILLVGICGFWNVRPSLPYSGNGPRWKLVTDTLKGTHERVPLPETDPRSVGW
jgi:hypothetical protein